MVLRRFFRAGRLQPRWPSFVCWLVGGAALLLSACTGNEPAATEPLPDLQRIRNLTPAQQLHDVSAALEQDPTNAALYQRRARLYLTLRDGAAAVADADQVLKLGGATAPNYLLRAQAHRAAGRLKEAQADCQQAARLGYEGPELPTLQGELAFIEREYQPAINFLNEALKRGPFEERAYFYKGMVYAETGDTTRAISNFQTAAEQAPEMADAYSQLAAIYHARKDYKTARQYLDAGLRTSPEDGFLYYNAGVNLALQGRTDSALTLFTRATALDSTLYLAHYNVGVLRYQRDEFGPAARHLRAVLRRAPQSPPNTRLMLADALDRLGQYRAAVREYALLAQAEPVDPRVTFRLYQAKTRLRQQQVDSAAGRAPRVVRLDSLRKIR
ncbi:MAG: tetratricopeptide repeat protein [Hymenobacteraceae bacterium]|nr:tetratricopeptide repeat protein [Hymenobacteraceae bacterium]